MIYDQLIEMGFGKLKVEKAIKFTNNEGLQSAIEWLVTHEMDDDGNIDNNIETCAATSGSINDNVETNIEGGSTLTIAKSMKCDDCGKLLKEMEIQLHASRYGHTNFSESVEELKPLSEEEKKIQLEKLQEKLKNKRLEREAQEAKESLERERYRRKQGKTIIDAKTKFEEEEIKRLADQKRKEKEEDRLYRERLKLQIANDRESRKQKQPVGEQISVSDKSSQPQLMKPASQDKFDNCRIQIRHSNGSVVLDTFPANGSLFQVATLFAEKSLLCQPQEVEFRTAMPPKLYGAESMNKSVNELGFCPSIVLMAVIKKNVF